MSTDPFGFPAEPRTWLVSDPLTDTGNEITASPGYTYTYDAEGNMTGMTQTSTGDVWTFGYDNRRKR